MVKLLVLYGHPDDPAAFDQYYRDVHIPIAKKMKGLKKWTIGKVTGTPGDDPPSHYLVAELYMESREDFDVMLSSPEGQATIADVPKFATGGVTFQYIDLEEIPCEAE